MKTLLFNSRKDVNDVLEIGVSDTLYFKLRDLCDYDDNKLTVLFHEFFSRKNSLTFPILRNACGFHGTEIRLPKRTFNTIEKWCSQRRIGFQELYSFFKMTRYGKSCSNFVPDGLIKS